MSTYPEIQLGDGTKAPGVAYGVGTSLFRQDCVDEVKRAIAAGFRHFDLAEIYETTGYVGQAIRDSGIDPNELYITTKLGEGLKNIPEAFNKELTALGLDFVGTLEVHWPHDFPREDFPTMEEAWRQMIEIKKSGKARSIGVSNFRLRDLEKLKRAFPNPEDWPAVNQIEYHPFLYETTEHVVEYCKEHNIALAAYSPLAPITRFSGGSFDGALEEVTLAVSERFGQKVTSSQVLLKLASQRGFLVVTTSNKDSRMKEALAGGALPDLTKEEQEKLVKAAKPSPQRAFPEHMGQLDKEY
ncbi:hypothetical protein JCM3765_001614 [Sporobolomyces pararoseus]